MEPNERRILDALRGRCACDRGLGRPNPVEDFRRTFRGRDDGAARIGPVRREVQLKLADSRIARDLTDEARHVHGELPGGAR